MFVLAGCCANVVSVFELDRMDGWPCIVRRLDGIGFVVASAFEINKL